MQKLAYTRLRRSILAGHVSPAQRLSHRRLAVELGVGQRPMREAMLRLDAEGLLEHFPQSGTRLRKPTPEEAVDLTELRQLIEPHAAARAARLATARQRDVLRRIAARMSELTPRLIRGGTDAWLGPVGMRVRSLDLQFHRSILRASGNSMFLTAFDRVGVLPLMFLCYPDVAATLEHDLRTADAEHGAIAGAIVAGDDAAARRMMETHLFSARGQFTSLRSTGPSKSVGGVE